MKLLYVSQYFPPEVGAGAVRAEIMVRHLSRLGWDIDVLTEIPNYPTGVVHPDYKKGWSHHERGEHYNIHRVWVKANERRNIWEQLTFFVSFMISSLLYALKNPQKYTLVYASSPPIFAAISGCLISKFLGTRFVLEIRDLWPDSAVDPFSLKSNSLFIRFGQIIEKWLYNSSDLIITVTPELQQAIRDKANHNRVKVVSNGVDIDLFRPIPQEMQELDEDIDRDKFRVGYVGSLGVIHDLRTFVSAAKICESHPDIEFVIVGDGGRNNQLHQLLNEIQPNNLTWVGLKEHFQIPHYISSFDVAVNPIHNSQAFRTIVTVKFYEYLACGIPVLNLAEGAQKRIAEESRASVILPIGNAQKLADEIIRLKENPLKIKEMSRNARQFITQSFSRKDQAYLLSDILHNFVSETIPGKDIVDK